MKAKVSSVQFIARAAVASVGVFASVTGATAADLGGTYRQPEYSIKDTPAPEPYWNWQGIYFGGNIGYGFDSSNLLSMDRITAPASRIGTFQGYDPEGIFGGLQAGYNWQRDRIVFGIETDIQLADIGDSAGGQFNRNPNFAGGASTSLDWFGTLRGRLGFVASERLLIYGTGGLAYGGVDFDQAAVNTGNGNTVRFSDSDTKVGYAVGGGLEYALDQNWSFKAEYLYIDLGDEDLRAESRTAGGVPTGINYASGYEAEFHTVRAGLNYKF